jgi:DNA mismatch repair protein MutS2
LRILHGKGEGVLRKVIREQLKRYKEVASFADEHVERGGDGITVVVLK